MTTTKRIFLLGSATLSVAAVTFVRMPAWSKMSTIKAPANFMALSLLLVNHRLDNAVGGRIGNAAGLCCINQQGS